MRTTAQRIMDVSGNVRKPSAGRHWLSEFPCVSALFFALISFAIFALPPIGSGKYSGGDVSILFNHQGIVWSAEGSDLVTAVVPWWSFGYRELARGNLPLWNPHNCCGAPFFSNFNPGLLYPPHLLNLFLPLQHAL